jgi:DNA-binding response OmpR family regulator
MVRGQNPEGRLLLIDDDCNLGRLMAQFLEEANLLLECAPDGLIGLERASNEQFDLILLDVGLPSLDGFSVLQKIRQTIETPVIMLTSRNTVRDRLAGLNSGADDYLPKPFDPDELVARIRAVMRRYDPAHRRVALVRNIGAIRIAEAERTVSVHGEPVEMTSIEFEVLLMLSLSPGQVVTRDALTRAILGRTPNFFDRSLDVHVSRIRAKLGKVGKMIRTIRGEGYMLTNEEAKHVAIP